MEALATDDSQDESLGCLGHEVGQGSADAVESTFLCPGALRHKKIMDRILQRALPVAREGGTVGQYGMWGREKQESRAV
jgi:threonine dehydrogenase-like Zn-dependent dehydrogenase